MKFIKLSFNYLFKNILYIFLLTLVPTAFIGALISPFRLFEFMTNYSSISVDNFGSIFYSLIDFKIVPIILTILGILVLSIFVSLTLGQMENHMRSGKISFKGMFQYLNNNILVVIANIFITLLIWFALQFLLSAILFLLHLMISGIGNAPNIANIIIAVVLCVAKFVLFMQILGVMLLNIPHMLISGYPTKQAIANSIKILNKSNFSYMIALILPFLIIIPLACCLKGNWCYLTNIVGVLILFMYYSSLCMTTYFDLTCTPRYDNRKYYNYD